MRSVLAAAGLALVASTALAADLPSLEPAPVVGPAPLVYDWSGFYVGINGGYGWGDSDFRFKDVGTSSNTSFDGGLIGGTVGYNFEFGGGFLIGLEGDMDWSGLSGSDACHNPAFDCKVDLNWLATVRGRAGYAFDRFLVYGTGGVAFGDLDYSVSPQVTPRLRGASDTQVGWTAGAGVEVALTQHWSVKGEYDYYDLGSESEGVGALSNLSRTTVDPTFSAVRVGVNYKF